MESLTLPAKLESLEPISAFVLAAAHAAGLDDHACWQVSLAVDEAATNIIQYAYPAGHEGTITIETELSAQALTMRLRDSGRGFDPNDVPPPDMQSPLEQRQVGGLGLYLMHQLMDEVAFSFDGEHGNTVTLVKHLTRREPAALVYRPYGRLDAAAAPALLNVLLDQARQYRWRVVIDLTDTTFISSSGLRALLLLMKELHHQGGDLRLCNLQPRVVETFQISGFDRVFAIDATEADALLALVTPALPQSDDQAGEEAR
jgi:serine/threonine-protein kinase RsbW